MTGSRGTVFDVAVVGGGAAGCVFAARLAESGSRSVVLLEAGPDRRTDPADELRDGWQITRRFEWGYTSEPDAHGGVENVRRNKLLGGTSWVTRFTPRGSPADYDAWAALGNTGWGFDDVLPYFLRLETDADFGDRPWHGDRGPIPSTRYLDLDYTDVAGASLDALQATGFPIVEDHNRPGAVGAGRMPMNSRDGARVTTADAYLPVGSTPTNLTIRAGAVVSDVVLDGDRACGVRLADGKVIEAGWVVLCAGTFGSPAILMRSGIGPVEHLRSAGAGPRRSGGRRGKPGRPPGGGRRVWRLPRNGTKRAHAASDRHVPQLGELERRPAGSDALGVRSRGTAGELRGRRRPRQASLTRERPASIDGPRGAAGDQAPGP